MNSPTDHGDVPEKRGTTVVWGPLTSGGQGYFVSPASITLHGSGQWTIAAEVVVNGVTVTTAKGGAVSPAP